MTGKNCLNLFVTVGVVLCLALFIGCKSKTISDYPADNDVSDIVSELEEETVNEETLTDNYGDDEELEDFMPNAYPFDTQGNFVYNPAALRPGVANYYRDKPEYLEMAKKILLAVNDAETMITLNEGYPITQEDFEEVLMIAELSNPVVYTAKFETEDYYSFKITYPDYFGALNEYGEFVHEDYVEDDKNFSAELDEFKDFINDVIDSNVNYQDNDMENARRIYKYLIENLYINDKDYFYLEVIYESDTGKPIYHFDVLRNLKNDRLYLHEFIKLYQFILTQLNIKTIYVELIGNPAMERYEMLNPESDYLTSVNCFAIEYDGVDYLCNPYYEYLDYKNFPMYENDTECHCNYFAVSKRTCNRTFLINTAAYSPVFEPTYLFEFDDLNVDYPFDDRDIY